MKPGRNALCPCGSGRKYKQCCYDKEQNAADENHLQSQGLQGNKGEDFLGELDERRFLLQALNNFRKFILNKKPHIKEYYRIRKMHSEIVGAMIQYHEDGKFEQRADADPVSQSGQGSEVHLIESNFDLETREGSHGFYDMLLYKSAPNASCITEDFIRSRRYRKPEKIEFLHSMLESRLGLFEVTKIDSDEGYAYLKEVFSGEAYTIVDVGLSGDKNHGEFYIYTRIITYRGISFGTGLSLVFSKTDRFIKKHIAHHRKDYNPNMEFLRFIQLYNQYSQNPDNIKIIANTLQ